MYSPLPRAQTAFSRLTKKVSIYVFQHNIAPMVCQALNQDGETCQDPALVGLTAQQEKQMDALGDFP